MPGKTDPFDNLIFEVNCLGCGHVAFSLPYREGTHHTMTCHRCGEVTIAHVLDGGHVAAATLAKRAEAIEGLTDQLRRHVEGSVVGLQSNEHDWWEGRAYELAVVESGEDFVVAHAEDLPNVLQVEVNVHIITEGLIARIQHGERWVPTQLDDYKDLTGSRLSEPDLPFRAPVLLVSSRSTKQDPVA